MSISHGPPLTERSRVLPLSAIVVREMPARLSDGASTLLNRIDRSARGLGSWRIRLGILRAKTFASNVFDRPNILDLSDSRVLRSEPATGAF